MKKLAYDAGRAFATGLAYAKGLRFAQTHKLAMDAKWITVHPNGKRDRRGDKIKGTPVLIDEESGKILGGMGSSPSKPKTLTKSGKVKEEPKKDADNEVSITYEDQQKQNEPQAAQVKTPQEQPKQNSTGDVIEGTDPSEWGDPFEVNGTAPEGEAEISYGKKTSSTQDLDSSFDDWLEAKLEHEQFFDNVDSSDPAQVAKLKELNQKKEGLYKKFSDTVNAVNDNPNDKVKAQAHLVDTVKKLKTDYHKANNELNEKEAEYEQYYHDVSDDGSLSFAEKKNRINEAKAKLDEVELKTEKAYQKWKSAKNVLDELSGANKGFGKEPPSQPKKDPVEKATKPSAPTQNNSDKFLGQKLKVVMLKGTYEEADKKFQEASKKYYALKESVDMSDPKQAKEFEAAQKEAGEAMVAAMKALNAYEAEEKILKEKMAGSSNKPVSIAEQMDIVEKLKAKKKSAYGDWTSKKITEAEYDQIFEDYSEAKEKLDKLIDAAQGGSGKKSSSGKQKKQTSKAAPTYGGMNPLIDSTPKYYSSAIRPTDKSYENNVLGVDAIRGITASPTKETPGYKTFVNYTGNGYKAINNYLRYGEHLDSARIEGCKQMDEFMNTHRTTEPMTVYRGVSQSVVDKIEQSGIYVDKGYSSTSATASVAKNWSDTAVLVLHVPKGYPCAFMEDITQVHHEDEILLARNTLSKVIECKIDKDGRKIFHLKVFPKD